MADRKLWTPILVSVEITAIILILCLLLGLDMWGILVVLLLVIAILPVFVIGIHFKFNDFPDRINKRKVCSGVAVGALLTIIPIMVCIFFLSGSGSVIVTAGDDDLNVNAPMVDRTVSFDDMISVEIRYDFDRGARVGGFGGTNISSGNFRCGEFGTYTLAVYKNTQAYIVIDDGHKIMVFNQETVDKTVELFYELKQKMS